MKKAGGLSPASRLNHLPVAALIQSNACSYMVTVPAMAVGAFYSVAEMALFFSLTLG